MVHGSRGGPVSKGRSAVLNKQSPAVGGCERQISGYVQVAGVKLCSSSLCRCLGCYACSISYWAYPAANRAFFSQSILGKCFFAMESKPTVKWPQACFGPCCSVVVAKRSGLLHGSYSLENSHTGKWCLKMCLSYRSCVHISKVTNLRGFEF